MDGRQPVEGYQRGEASARHSRSRQPGLLNAWLSEVANQQDVKQSRASRAVDARAADEEG